MPGWRGLTPSRASPMWGHPGALLVSPPLRILHRPRKCNIPRFCQILGEIFCFCIAWDDWTFIGI
jgi:hypothetical protein